MKSFVYAGRGLHSLVRTEHNAWLHLAATVAVVTAGFALKISLGDWRWITLAIAMVWIAEAFNTAIEELCDRITDAFDPAIGRVKDLAAGAVLLASIGAAIIGALTLGPAAVNILL
jgi:diacylglycerol kinase (ATP)